MLSPAAPLQQSAHRLSVWLGAWRILSLVSGGLGLAALLRASLYAFSATSASGPLGPVLWLLALATALLALSLWVYWNLLHWGKEWVDGSAQLAQRGGDPARLQQLSGALGRWITGIVWVTLTFYGISMFVAWVIIREAAVGMPVEVAVIWVILAVLLGIPLIGVYFPSMALHRFLSEAAARLSGRVLRLKPAAYSLNTWCTALAALQVLGLILHFLVAVPEGESSGSDPRSLLALLLHLPLAALSILPLLAAGRYAKALASALDSGLTHGSARPSARDTH